MADVREAYRSTVEELHLVDEQAPSRGDAVPLRQRRDAAHLRGNSGPSAISMTGDGALPPTIASSALLLLPSL